MSIFVPIIFAVLLVIALLVYRRVYKRSPSAVMAEELEKRHDWMQRHDQ